MLLIFVNKVTSRVRYTFHIIFNEVLGVPFELTGDQEVFLTYEGPKFSYGKNPLGSELFFGSAGLLFERGIEGQELSFLDREGGVAFYPTFSKSSALPFDPFAASFYLLSRYEEYLPYVKDQFDRFDALTSISYQKGFLKKPVVNIWAMEVEDLISQRFPGFSTNMPEYDFIPTIDVDAAWRYRAKGLVRSIGGYLRSLAFLQIREITARTRVLAGSMDDPFDTYDQQLQFFNSYGLRPIYFILFAEYGLNDKSINPSSPPFQVLVKSLADHTVIGLHNSFNSSFDVKRLEAELNHLSEVIHREINKSRQHYLRLNLPNTYRNLVDLDVFEDYSMGYNSHVGFRAGIATPFTFYDLDLETNTKLKIFPFAFGVNRFHPVKSAYRINEIMEVIGEVKKVKGTLVGMWDNEVLTGFHDEDWLDRLKQIVEAAL